MLGSIGAFLWRKTAAEKDGWQRTLLAVVVLHLLADARGTLLPQAVVNARPDGLLIGVVVVRSSKNAVARLVRLGKELVNGFVTFSVTSA